MGMHTKSTIMNPTEGGGGSERSRRLLVMSPDAVAAVPLPPTGVLTIGRSSRASIRIEDPRASREHFRLHLGEAIQVEDLNSANGTLLRDEKLVPESPQPAYPGEPIKVGSTVLMIMEGPVALDVQGAAAPTPVRTMSGASAMARLEEMAARAAASPISLLLRGETGVGKEVLARKIHASSKRASGPLVAINCAGLTEALIESELFGYQKGAFTGAVQPKPGLIEAAHGGTLFLDEVGEMPAGQQAKLLRVLETREVLPVGALKPRTVDVRFVAATNRDLENEAMAGRFRSDLFFRLNGLCLWIPPLRERLGEIPTLANRFIAQMSQTLGRTPPVLSDEVLDLLRVHPWPGNIRELKNVIERAVVLCDGPELRPEHLVLDSGAQVSAPAAPANAIDHPGAALRERANQGAPAHLTPAQQLERERIVNALADCTWNQTRAAERLGMARRTLITKMIQYRIPRPQDC
jgi:transcriptional regulator with PAS, ATPase and Fis domain